MDERGRTLPAVSVIVPVHNGESTLASCIESLLSQDYPRDRFEIIVVDNRSTDGTAAIASRYPIRLLHERTTQSSYAARNLAIAHSTSEYLLFTDADCVADGSWARNMAAALAPDGVGGVAGHICAFRSDSPVEQYQASRALQADRAYEHPHMPFAQTANAGYKRIVFEQIGAFDPNIVFGGDLDFAWRMQALTDLRLAYAPDAVIRHRHRTTTLGLFRLYQKNAIAYCLLAQRHPYYRSYPRLRTGLYLARECLRSALHTLPDLLRRGDEGDERRSYYDAIAHAGAAHGWLRWHYSRTIPRVEPIPALEHTIQRTAPPSERREQRVSG